MKTPRFATLVAFLLIAALSRLVPHPWNATPVAAMALFAGAQFSDWRSALVIPLLALFVGDIFLGFYATLPITYLCFALTVGIGRGIRANKSIVSIVSASVAASVMFFVVTNFACWLSMPEYTKDAAGFSLCYTLALPFFRNTLTGDLFFSALLFGGFALSEKAFPRLREPAIQPA